MRDHRLSRHFLPGRHTPFHAWQVEITTRCPLACRMCIKQGLPGWRHEDMSLADFSRLVPYLPEVRTVVLQGWGEPLLHKDLVPIIRAAKEGPAGMPGYLPPEVGFITSGTGLDSPLSAALIWAGLDFIGFSFAGSTAGIHEQIRVRSDFETLAAAVQTFIGQGGIKGRRGPRAHIVFQMLRDNMGDLPSVPRLAREIGIRSVILTNLIHVATAWQDAQRVFSCGGPVAFAELLRETEAIASELGVALRVPSLAPRTIKVCEEDPLRNLYVSVNGDVSPCVYLNPPVPAPFVRFYCGRELQVQNVVFGNVFRDSVETVWNSDAYGSFRREIEHRDRGLGVIASFLHALRSRGWQHDRQMLPDPPIPCRTCHKMLGV